MTTKSSSSSSSSSPFKDVVTLPENVEFSLKDIRNAIPKHCFERSYAKSFFHLGHDLAMIALLFYLGSCIDGVFRHVFVLRVLARTLYWYLQGAFMTGAWVIAHECGHHAFSPSKWLNNVVGFLVHTMLLVPYFSWQYTHSRHHLRTNNLMDDTVHVPRMKYAKRIHFDVAAAAAAAASTTTTSVPSLNPTPPPTSTSTTKTKKRSWLSRVQRLSSLTLLGWPLYLLFNLTGAPKYDSRAFTNHFNPFCSLFPAAMKPFVWLSDAGLVAWLYVLYRVVYVRIGALALLNLYVVPYVIVNFWLVTITFLHHTDRKIVRYMPSEWSWIRGAFGTIDRSYGWFLNYAHHHISDTHLVHHLFSTMPHYHAVEATQALKRSQLLGKYHLVASEPFYVTLWNILSHGRWCVPINNETIMLMDG